MGPEGGSLDSRAWMGRLGLQGLDDSTGCQIQASKRLLVPSCCPAAAGRSQAMLQKHGHPRPCMEGANGPWAPCAGLSTVAASQEPFCEVVLGCSGRAVWKGCRHLDFLQ